MDMQSILAMAQQLRGQLEAAQQNAERARFLGEAGGGIVRVVTNGKHEVVEITVDPKVLGPAVKPDDLRLLEDLLRAAVNQAMRQVATDMQTTMGSLAQGLGVDLGALGLGGGGAGRGR